MIKKNKQYLDKCINFLLMASKDKNITKTIFMKYLTEFSKINLRTMRKIHELEQKFIRCET